MKTTFIGRKFQLWQFRVSHGELLIRSPKNAIHPRNVDLMFAGVEYIDLPRFLLDLEIDVPIEADLSRARERLGKPVDHTSVAVLKSAGRRYIVVAAAIKVVESDMDIFESPFQ